MTQLIAIKDHFLTSSIRVAQSAFAIGPEDTAGLDLGKIGARRDDLGAQRLALLDESDVAAQMPSIP